MSFVNKSLHVLAGRLITTTKGDLLVDDGTKTVRQAVGSDGKILATNSNTNTGIEWKTLTSTDIGIPKSNFDATNDPDVTNDSTEGYSIGSIWINSISRNQFVNMDASIGAAVWKQINGINSIENIGNSGIGIYSGTNEGSSGATTKIAQLKNIRAASSKITVTNNVGTNTVDLNVDESQININNLTGLPNGDLVGTTASQTLTNKTLGSDLNMGSFNIINLANPNNGNDAANKSYVDAVAQGLQIKAAVMLASTGDLSNNSSVASYSYNASGGSAGTGQITGNLSISNQFILDGVTLTNDNNNTRILLKDQTSGAQNGIWIVTISGTSFTLNRATDFNTNANVLPNSFMFVEEGTTNADNGWVLTTNAPINVGTTVLNFTQFSGAGSINAGNGLTKSGNTIDVVGSTLIASNPNNIQINSSIIANQTLLSSGTVGTEPTYGALPLNNSNSVTGILPIANGGTGSSILTMPSKLIATNSGGTSLETTSLDPANIVTAQIGTATTTNATPTTILSLATSSNKAYFLQITVIGRRTNSGNETAIGYNFRSVFLNTNGIVSKIGEDILYAPFDTNYVVATSISGTTINIIVTGVASQNLLWNATMTVTSV